MPLFGRNRNYRSREPYSERRGHRASNFAGFRKEGPDRDHVAAGYKSALSNPNTTRSGRKHAKRELRFTGRGDETHVPLMTKIKRALGIRSTPRRERHREDGRYRHTRRNRREYI